VLVLAPVAVVAALGLLLLSPLLRNRGIELEPGPMAREPSARDTVATAPSSSEGVQVWPVDERECPPPRTRLRGDVDGDGCEESLAFREGVLIGDDVRLAVGAPDDIAVTGDWDCDGQATLVLLRPASGSVWHFREWPIAGASVTATLITRQPSAVVVTPRNDGACDQLDIGLADGTAITVAVPRQAVGT
jgi:hypothetical protein